MPFPARILAALCLLLCQACNHLDRRANDIPVSTHTFHFEGGGKARYFVLDKRPKQNAPSGIPSYPTVYLFVIPGSDCGSMQGILPSYFDGLEGRPGATRIFILHKRFMGMDARGECSTDFIQADHPTQWIADQDAFIRAELSAAGANGQPLERVAIVGSSEGAEIAPILAQRIPGITHVALLANGGMNPFDTYRLQMQRHGFHQAPADIERLCIAPSDDIMAAGRTCRYWKELQAIRHTDNLLALDMPVFIAMGETDTMVPVEAAWHIRDQFAGRGKTNLHLLTFPDTGHDFHRNGESVLPYLWEALEQWLQK